MASLNELKEALLHTLAAKGSLGQMKARIRAEIFSALDAQDDESVPRPPLSNTNLLINELIREYLAFNQYRYTMGVFLPEANQPEVPPFDRSFISRELHVQENQHSVQIPLLYSIVALLQQGKVAESSAGVPMHDLDPSLSPLQQTAFQPQASMGSSTASYNMQPGQAQSAYADAQQAMPPQQQQQPQQQTQYRGQQQQPPPSYQQAPPQSQPPTSRSTHFGDDAPRPLHFTNRQ